MQLHVAQAEPSLLPPHANHVPHAPGVYFDLPMADYHADPSLGSTDLKALLVHPAIYWQRSSMNPARQENSDTPAKKMGRALHSLVLEGELAFAKAFIEEPTPAGFPDALASAEDLRNYVRRHLLKGAGTTKAEMAKAIKKHDPTVQIWDDIKSLFDAMVVRSGLEVLKPEAMAEVCSAAANITLNPHLARAFKGGAPEVSVFWTDENGLPCKARHDYVKPKTLVNLKRFANQRQRPVDIAIHLAIAEYRYDVQAKHYLDSYPHLFAAAKEGRVFGPCALPEGWEDQLADPEAITYTWIFHQMDGPAVTVGRQLSLHSSALNRATRDVAKAKAIYADCIAKYGTERWVSDEPIADLLDTDLPVWMREELEVL